MALMELIKPILPAAEVTLPIIVSRMSDAGHRFRLPRGIFPGSPATARAPASVREASKGHRCSVLIRRRLRPEIQPSGDRPAFDKCLPNKTAHQLTGVGTDLFGPIPLRC